MTVNQEDFDNAGLDLQTISEVANVNYSGDDTTNREGTTIATLTGQLKKLGYLVPVTYAGAISFTVSEGTKTVEESGGIYAPLPSALPFTTSGTWVGDDDARFFVVQTAAADSVIYSNTTSGLSATNVQDAIDEVDSNQDAADSTIGHLNNLSGVAVDADNLGTFSGTTITDNSTNKVALQELETAVEASSVVASAGTWTPTVTGIVDYNDSIINKAHYQRVDNIVSFVIDMEARPSSGPTTFSFRMTIPVASNFDDVLDVIGFGFDYTDNIHIETMSANVANDEISVSLLADDFEYYKLKLIGSYQIK